MSKLLIETLTITDFLQNCRILWKEGSDEAIVIDPGGEVEKILQALKKNALTVKEIWLTHSHIDHCGGVQELKERSGAILQGHHLGVELRQNVEDICEMYNLPTGTYRNSPEPDLFFDEGDTLLVGDTAFKVFFTPGHAPDHVVFYCEEEKLLIAGDTIFAGSIGRTDFPGCSYELLMSSIHEKILVLPEETIVLPGHGPNTTVGKEKRENPFLK